MVAANCRHLGIKNHLMGLTIKVYNEGGLNYRIKLWPYMTQLGKKNNVIYITLKHFAWAGLVDFSVKH
ncbi:hypothetical protein ASE93_05670 [Serratia sp. Leaf50]|nr:hypothetical protein ASE93_05670 [Serratia sp. Leaf50]